MTDPRQQAIEDMARALWREQWREIGEPEEEDWTEHGKGYEDDAQGVLTALEALGWHPPDLAVGIKPHNLPPESPHPPESSEGDEGDWRNPYALLRRVLAFYPDPPSRGLMADVEACFQQAEGERERRDYELAAFPTLKSLDSAEAVIQRFAKIEDREAGEWLSRHFAAIRAFLSPAQAEQPKGETETRRLVYCTYCHKTHSVKPDEQPCAPGAWLDPQPQGDEGRE